MALDQKSLGRHLFLAFTVLSNPTKGFYDTSAHLKLIFLEMFLAKPGMIFDNKIFQPGPFGKVKKAVLFSGLVKAEACNLPDCFLLSSKQLYALQWTILQIIPNVYPSTVLYRPI